MPRSTDVRRGKYRVEKLQPMNIKFFCPHWGSEKLDYKSFFEKVKNAGYDGVEMSFPNDQSQKSEIIQLLQTFELDIIAQHWETSTANFSLHKKEFRERLINLASIRPLFINTQTGKDFFKYEQNAELIEIAIDISQKFGIKVIHETHRGKFGFASHIMSEYLRRIPELRLTLDISHWVNVAESWLEDQKDMVNLALSRTDHIHARIGFPEGPQIPDPRAPEWKLALDKHVTWWQQVVNFRRKNNQEGITITPEFGPYPYMTILPTSKEPIANQWEVNLYMMEYLKHILN